MLISMLFVGIIIVYGFIGLKKGGIKSIGGLISSAVKIVPLGEKLDKSIGFISGVVKGLIVAIIVYFILYTVNMIPNVHIPLYNTVLNNVMQMIGGF